MTGVGFYVYKQHDYWSKKNNTIILSRKKDNARKRVLTINMFLYHLLLTLSVS